MLVSMLDGYVHRVRKSGGEREREWFKCGNEWSAEGKAGKVIGKRVSWRVLAGIWGGCLAARAVHFNARKFLHFILLWRYII